MKEGKCTKSLAKNWVCTIFHTQDIQKNVSFEFIKLIWRHHVGDMETPCWCPFEGHKYGCQKSTKTSVFEFSYKYLNSLLEKLIKFKVIIIIIILSQEN